MGGEKGAFLFKKPNLGGFFVIVFLMFWTEIFINKDEESVQPAPGMD